MAAIQIAHHLGAEVIASAGSPAKRALLETLGVKHVIDSRRGDFAEAVMELTDGRGVRCGAQRARRRSHPDGPLLPRGVRPLHRNRQARHLPKLAHPAVAAAPQRLVPRRRHGRGLRGRRSADPRAARRKSRSWWSKARCTRCRSAPSRPSRVDAAFRLMAERQTHRQSRRVLPRSLRRAPRRTARCRLSRSSRTAAISSPARSADSARCSPNGWSNCGARHLVLSSRSGAATPEAKAFVKNLRGSRRRP